MSIILTKYKTPVLTEKIWYGYLLYQLHLIKKEVKGKIAVPLGLGLNELVSLIGFVSFVYISR